MHFVVNVVSFSRKAYICRCSGACVAAFLSFYIFTGKIMASRRNLKKVITFIVDDLATEAFLVSYNAKADTEAWVNVFNKIFSLNNDYVARVSHVEPGMPAKKYFNALCESFNKDAKAILDEISQLSK